jgi:hypothetical protein
VVECSHVKDESLVRRCVAIVVQGLTAVEMWESGPGMFSEAIPERTLGSRIPAPSDALAAGGWLGVLAFVYTAGAARPGRWGNSM